jgi:hypothetical protein
MSNAPQIRPELRTYRLRRPLKGASEVEVLALRGEDVVLDLGSEAVKISSTLFWDHVNGEIEEPGRIQPSKTAVGRRQRAYEPYDPNDYVIPERPPLILWGGVRHE